MCNQTDNELNVQYAPLTLKKEYTAVHGIFAVLVLALSYIYKNIDIYAGEQENISAFIFTMAFYVFAAVFYIVRGKRHFGKEQIFFTAVTLVYSLHFVLYNDYTEVSYLAFFVMHITALLSLSSAEKSVCVSIVPETLRSVFVYPFKCFLALPKSLIALIIRKNKDKGAKKSASIGYIFVGMCAVAPVLAVLAFLLCSDRAFDEFAGATFKHIGDFFDKFSLSEYINIFTVLIGMYIFGAICASEEPHELRKQKTNFFPPQIVNTMLIMTILLYIFFFVAQINSYVGMIFGKLPDGMTYAEFARSGFFQLCAAACINGALIYFLYTNSDPSQKNKKLPLLSAVLACATLLLVFNSAVKMGMYVNAYGFTEKRFYAIWFMTLLFVLFILSLVKIKKSEFKLSQYGAVITSVFFAILFLINYSYLSENINVLLGFTK